MRQSIVKLESFYSSRLGLAAQAMTLRRLHTLWPHLEGLDVLGYGYALPYLEGCKKGAHRLIHAMPSEQGAVHQINRRGNASILVGDEHLPFLPTTFDRVLVAHGLEEASELSGVLTELWRVMKPEGRIVIVAANRAGLWARSDKTPFGAGRPFTRTQLSKALKQAGFIPLVRSGALYCPPVKAFSGPRTSAAFESFGETVWPGFSGLVLVEAVKRLYTGRITQEQKRVLGPNFSGALGTSSTKVYQIKNTLEHHEKN